MQVVGRACESCGKRLAVSTEGAGCLKCDVVFHRKCLKRPDVCPHCKQSFDEQEELADREERNLIARQLERGRAFVILAMVLILGIQLASTLFEVGAQVTSFMSAVAAFLLLLLPATRVFLEERRRLREGDPQAARR
jgi:hypothetical protein